MPPTNSGNPTWSSLISNFDPFSNLINFFSVDGEFEASWKPNMVIQSDGHVLWIPPIIYKTSCEVDVTYFPFDQQSCRMDLGSWTYTKDQVTLAHDLESSIGGTSVL